MIAKKNHEERVKLIRDHKNKLTIEKQIDFHSKNNIKYFLNKIPKKVIMTNAQINHLKVEVYYQKKRNEGTVNSLFC